MNPVDSSVVLAPYLEPVVRGRRVVVLGDAMGSIGPGLFDRGARLVHVYDPDPVRVAEAAARRPLSRTLVYAPLPEGDLAVRDGAFDLAVIPDLTAFEQADDVIARARRLVAQSGLAVIASPNADIAAVRAPSARSRLLSYYELYDAVALQFPEVRMLGQAPFAGWVIADFAPEQEPEVVVDTSLLERGAEEPSWFVAVASQRPQRLDAYTIVQVPQQLFGTTEAAVREDPRATAELAQARAAMVPLEQELAQLRQTVKHLEARGAIADRAEQLEDRLRSAESRAGDNHVRAGQLEGRVRDLEEELRRQRERAFKLSNEVEEEKKQRTKAELELNMIRRSSELPPKLDRARELEAARSEAEARVQSLQEELSKSSQQIRTLQEELSRSSQQLRTAQSELAKSSQQLRTVQGELSESRARIRELEATVARTRDELDDARASEAALAPRMLELQRLVAARDERTAKLDAELVELQERDSRVDERLAQRVEDAERERDRAVSSLEHMRESQEQEVASLEQALVERARELMAARFELRRREELVRELLSLLEERSGTGSGEAGGGGGNGHTAHSLRTQLDELAELSARREVELQQARWQLAQLGPRPDAGESTDSIGELSALEQALFTAQNELDVLRQSLQHERQLRERAEAGSELAGALAQAQADLQAQAVLAASILPLTNTEHSSG